MLSHCSDVVWDWQVLPSPLSSCCSEANVGWRSSPLLRTTVAQSSLHQTAGCPAERRMVWLGPQQRALCRTKINGEKKNKRLKGHFKRTTKQKVALFHFLVVQQGMLVKMALPPPARAFLSSLSVAAHSCLVSWSSSLLYILCH